MILLILILCPQLCQVWVNTVSGNWRLYLDCAVMEPLADNSAPLPIISELLPRAVRVASSKVLKANDDIVRRQVERANVQWTSAFASKNFTGLASLCEHTAVSFLSWRGFFFIQLIS